MSKRLLRAALNATQRCTNEKHPQWHDYGGRGIEVRFVDAEAFAAYLATLDGCNDASLVLDRADNDGHYEVGNLQFVTREESAWNRRPSQRRELTCKQRAAQRRAQRAEADAIRANELTLLSTLDAWYLSNLRGNMPQKILARRAGVAQPRISQAENGNFSKMSRQTLLRVLKVYAQLDANNVLGPLLSALSL